MPENPRTANPARINVNDSKSVAYWAALLGVSEERLCDAVSRVGDLVVDVRRYLKK